MSLSDNEYLQFVADSRLQQLGIEPIYGSKTRLTLWHYRMFKN